MTMIRIASSKIKGYFRVYISHQCPVASDRSFDKASLVPTGNWKLDSGNSDDFELLGSIPEKLIPAEYFFSDDMGITKPNDDVGDFVSFTQEWVYNNGKAKLLDYLAKAEKTTHDCRLYLKKWDVPPKTIKKIIDEAIDRKWLSDERYAALYAAEALLCERSPIDTRHKLLQKRINPDIIEKAITKVFDKDNTKDIIKNQIEKLQKRYTELTPQKQFDKIATALYRKGFEYNEYEGVLREMIDQ